MNILLGVPAYLDWSRCFLCIGIARTVSPAPETIMAVWPCLIAFDMTRLAGDAACARLENTPARRFWPYWVHI